MGFSKMSDELEKKVAELEKSVDEIKIISREWMRAGAVILAVLLAWMGVTSFIHIPQLVRKTSVAIAQAEIEKLRVKAKTDAAKIASIAAMVGGPVYSCPYSGVIKTFNSDLDYKWSWTSLGCVGQLSSRPECRNVGWHSTESEKLKDNQNPTGKLIFNDIPCTILSDSKP
jgi:hypothetical protein